MKIGGPCKGIQGPRNEKSQTEVWLEVSTKEQGELFYGWSPEGPRG